MANNLPSGWKKMTQNRLDYLKEYDRIQNLQLTTSRSMDIKIPLYVRQRDIKRLQGITQKTIMEQGRELPRQSDRVMDTVQEMVETFNFNILKGELSQIAPNTHTSPFLQAQQSGRIIEVRTILENAINESGADEVARRLNDRSARRLVELVQNAIYPSNEDESMNAVIEFATLVKGRPLTISEMEELTRSHEESFYQVGQGLDEDEDI